MTVKPPGGPGTTPPLSPEVNEKKAVDAEKAFSLDSAGAAGRVPGDVAAEVTRAVREGGMTVAQAVEALVDKTLADPAFGRLPAERLEALRTELREVLASDPVLSSLAGQIGR
jgi:hypothetical protein